MVLKTVPVLTLHKRYILLFLLGLGLSAFVPSQAKVDEDFSKYFTSGAVATVTIARNTTSLVLDAAYQDCKGLCVD